MVLNHHVYHAIHHDLTTNLPSKKHHFSRNPPQKRPRNRKNPPLTGPQNFIKNIELIEPDSKPIEREKPLSNLG
jgi:hypothetical protein